jgi:hypothetical protein
MARCAPSPACGTPAGEGWGGGVAANAVAEWIEVPPPAALFERSDLPPASGRGGPSKAKGRDLDLDQAVDGGEYLC